MLVLLTGATGLLGSHLVDLLARHDVTVRALVRPSSDIRHLQQLGAQLVYGDAGNQSAIQAATEGVEMIFHVAAYLTAEAPFGGDGKGDGEWSRYQAVNVDFTESLLQAALETGARRFVYVSSNSVYSLDAPVPTPEDAPLKPVSLYGRSKLLAEKKVRTYQALGLDTTIIRPPVIYGPGDRYFTPMALRLARLPLLPLIDGGHNLMDLVYVADVARLLWRAAQHEAAVGQVYNAGPGQPTTLDDLVQAYRRVTGHGPRILPVQRQAALRMAPLSRLLVKPFLPEVQAALTAEGMAIMSQDFHLDMSRAERELDFKAQISLDRGLALTLQ